MFATKLILLVTLLSYHAMAQSFKCYCRSQNKIHPICNALTPCGLPNSDGFVQCCSGLDVCGADGFCHFTHPLNGSSGYYLGGCTDPTFQDPSCPQDCTNFLTQDVVYSESTSLWSCCYNPALGLDCSDPTTETFEAPSPERLFAKPFSLLTATSTSTQSSTISTPSTTSVASMTILAVSLSSAPIASSTSISAQLPGAQQQTHSPPGLSPKAKGGIALGVILVVLAGLGALLVFFLRRRSRNAIDTIEQPYPKQDTEQEMNDWQGHKAGRPSPTQHKVAELPEPARRVAELPGESIR